MRRERGRRSWETDTYTALSRETMEMRGAGKRRPRGMPVKEEAGEGRPGGCGGGGRGTEGAGTRVVNLKLKGGRLHTFFCPFPSSSYIPSSSSYHLCLLRFFFFLCLFFSVVATRQTIELKDVETVEQYEFLLNEIEIMKQLDHPNIAR